MHKFGIEVFLHTVVCTLYTEVHLYVMAESNMPIWEELKGMKKCQTCFKSKLNEVVSASACGQCRGKVWIWTNRCKPPPGGATSWIQHLTTSESPATSSIKIWSPHASGATRPPAGTLLQQCAGVVSTVSSYLPVACLNFSQNMVSSPSRSILLLSLPPTFLLLLLPNLSSPGKTGLLVAGGEGAMTSAEVAFPLNVVLPSFKYQTFTHRCLIQNPNIPTATRLPND